MILEAGQVKVDDYLYNPYAKHFYKHPEHRWVRVSKIESRPNRIILHTIAWQTWKHPKEAIAVRRYKLNVND
jgi:hypothetical protein